MRASILIAVACGLLAACQTTVSPTSQSETQREATEQQPMFTAQKLVVQKEVKAGEPYQVGLFVKRNLAEGADVSLCFFWDQEGPFCASDDIEVRKLSDGGWVFQTTLTTGNPKTYTLSAILRYKLDTGKSGETSPVSAQLKVIP